MREEIRDVERLNHMLEAINVLINYYKIRPAQLWETIVTDIPGIKPIIEQLILQEKSE